MKFAKQMTEESSEFPEDWRNNLISYKLLKKYIKRCLDDENSGDGSDKDLSDDHGCCQGLLEKSNGALDEKYNIDIKLTVDCNQCICVKVIEKKIEGDFVVGGGSISTRAISEKELNFLVLLVKEVNNVNHFYQGLMKELEDEKKHIVGDLVKLFRDYGELNSKGSGKDRMRHSRKRNKMAELFRHKKGQRTSPAIYDHTGKVLGSRDEVIMRQFIQILMDVSTHLDMSDSDSYAKKKMREFQDKESTVAERKKLESVESASGERLDVLAVNNRLRSDVELKKEDKSTEEQRKLALLLFNEAKKNSENDARKEEMRKVRLLLRQTKILKRRTSQEDILDVMEECIVLFERTHKIKNYVALNLTAVSKILKKLDKSTGLSLRNAFVQELFKAPSKPSANAEKDVPKGGSSEILITSENFKKKACDEGPECEEAFLRENKPASICESSKMLSALLSDIEQEAMSHLPLLEDCECCLCMQICYVPYKLPECGHRFCDACLFRCYVEQIESCPLCRQHYGVMSPEHSKEIKACVDSELKEFIDRFFPKEAKAKEKETKHILNSEREKLKTDAEREYQEMVTMYSGGSSEGKCSIL